MFHQSSYKCSQAIHVPLNTPVRVYCLQNPQSGALNLLLAPGGPWVAGDVDRVEVGPGVRVLVRGEVGGGEEGGGGQWEERKQEQHCLLL